MPVSNNTFARQYPGDRRRDYEFPRNKRLFKRFNGENGSRRIAMSALLAGSRCSIRVVSFLIERCDPFYYSALLSSIMRPDTARYPFATREYLYYPRSTVFQFRRRSVAASLSRRSRTVTRCTTGVQRHEQLRSFVLRAETGPIRLLPKIEKIGCARLVSRS